MEFLFVLGALVVGVIGGFLAGILVGRKHGKTIEQTIGLFRK